MSKTEPLRGIDGKFLSPEKAIAEEQRINALLKLLFNPRHYRRVHQPKEVFRAYCHNFIRQYESDIIASGSSVEEQLTRIFTSPQPPEFGDPKRYRFYYHYNKPNKCLTVHYKGDCLFTDAVRIHVPTESKRNKRQPLITIQGWCTNLKHTRKLTIIS